MLVSVINHVAKDNTVLGLFVIRNVLTGTTPCGINEESSAACGTNAQDCAEKVFDMVMGVGNVIYKIADTVVSGGGFSNLTQIAKNAAISGLKTAAKSTAKEVAKLSLEQLKQVIQQKNPSLPPAAVDNLAKMEKNPDTFDYVGFLINIDPTGLWQWLSLLFTIYVLKFYFYCDTLI